VGLSAVLLTCQRLHHPQQCVAVVGTSTLLACCRALLGVSWVRESCQVAYCPQPCLRYVFAASCCSIVQQQLYLLLHWYSLVQQARIVCCTLCCSVVYPAGGPICPLTLCRPLCCGIATHAACYTARLMHCIAVFRSMWRCGDGGCHRHLEESLLAALWSAGMMAFQSHALHLMQDDIAPGSQLQDAGCLEANSIQSRLYLL
jgi:hypothetical protein